MITEVAEKIWDNFRCTWETRGDNIKLSWEIQSGKVPPLPILEQKIKSQLMALPEIRLSSVQNARLKPQIISAIQDQS